MNEPDELLRRLECLLSVERESRLGGQRLTPEELLKGVVCAMCDFPEAVKVNARVTQHSANFDIEVHPDDVSKVIGSGGSHAFALRTVFAAVYGRIGKKLNLLVVDPKRRR